MQIGVIGVGYVGTVQVAVLLRLGYPVLAYDLKEAKRTLLQMGHAPVTEPGCTEVIAAAVKSGQLTVAESEQQVFETCDAVIICVGTPQSGDGLPDLTAVENVFAVAAHVDTKACEIILRSTVPPGTTRRLAQTLPFHLQVHHHPEFMREGTALADAENPALVVMGGPVEPQPTILDSLYAPYGLTVTRTGYETSELLKYACNAFHACKVAFANEMGALANHLDIDGVELLKLLRMDTRLNASGAYLRMGGPFGGPCLPKDLSALCAFAEVRLVGIPLLASIQRSNVNHHLRILRAIDAHKPQHIGLLGLGFKAGSEDLRSSPMTALANELDGPLSICDPMISRPLLQQAVPGATVVTSPEVLVAVSDLIVIGAASSALRRALRTALERKGSGTALIDLEPRP